MPPKPKKPGATNSAVIASINRNSEVLTRLAEVMEKQRFPVAPKTARVEVFTSALATALDGILAKIIADPATQPKQDAIIAKMLVAPSTEAKQDVMESSLNTLIAANAANFALNIAEIALMIVELGVQTALSIAAITANAVTIVAGIVAQTTSLNNSLQDIENKIIVSPSTEAKQDTIIGHVNGLEGLIGTTNSNTNQIESDLTHRWFVDGGVNGTQAITNGNNTLRVRPDTQTSQILKSVAITNNMATLPAVFRFHWANGSGLTNEMEDPPPRTVLAQTTEIIDLDIEIRRLCFLEVVSSINADANEFALQFAFHGDATDITFSSPT